MTETKKILILEDELIIAQSIKIHLDRNGYDCEIAQNPEEGREALQTFRFSGMICDINLESEMDGIGFVQNYVDDYMAVVFLTAYRDVETMKMAEKVTPHAYLTKPFNKDHLLMTLNLAIENHKKRFAHELPEYMDIHKIDLTDREIEIVQLIARSQTSAEIADALFISPQTVATHRKNIIRKTGAKSVIDLVSLAVEMHWI